MIAKAPIAGRSVARLAGTFFVFCLAFMASAIQDEGKKATEHEWNRQAFGAVLAGQKPPLRGTKQPHQLAKKAGPEPAAAAEVRSLGALYQAQHQLQGTIRPLGVLHLSGSLVAIQALPGAGMSLSPFLDVSLFCQLATRPRDYGPPALPILMVRAARMTGRASLACSMPASCCTSIRKNTGRPRPPRACANGCASISA